MTEVKTKKILFYIFSAFISMIVASNCYGDNQIDIEKYPAYFPLEGWKSIIWANELTKGRVAKVTVAMLDGDVDTDVHCLKDKSNNIIREKIKGENLYTDTAHGTAVMGLILGNHCELPVCNERYYCSGEIVVVAGIAQGVTLTNGPILEGGFEESMKNIVTAIDPNKEEEEEIKTWGSASGEQLPKRIILNLSEGPNSMAVFLEKIQGAFAKMSRGHIETGDLEKGFDFLFLNSYITNNMTWVKPVWADLNYWEQSKNRTNILKEAYLDKELQKRDDVVKSYKNAMLKHVFPKKDYFMVVVAAGNDGEEQSNDTAGPLFKNGGDNEPIIGVAAGCGESYKRLCSIAHGDAFDSAHGNEVIDIVAPGVNIPVILPLKDLKGNLFIPGVATYVDGTSFSAPLVTGAIVLLSQCRPGDSAEKIKKILFDSADKYTDLEGSVIGGKVLNIKRAIDMACKNTPAPNSEKPESEDEKEEL